MYELCLFAGAGGGLLATKHLLGWRTVCYVELDAYCQEVLKARIRDGLLDDAPIWDDVRNFDGRPWRGCVDIVTAGFPCQPFSCAGKRRGKIDKRNLWPDTIRVIDQVRPEWCLLENSPNLRCPGRTKDQPTPTQAGYLGEILRDLAGCGFDARWTVLSARDVGANHRRRRLWIVAHARGVGRNPWGQYPLQSRKSEPDVGVATAPDTNRQGELQSRELLRQVGRRLSNRLEDVADTAGSRLPQRQRKVVATEEIAGFTNGLDGRNWWKRWPAEPALCGVDDGVAHRVDRTRTIGEGQVPAVAAAAWRLLSGQGDQ